MQTSCCCCLQEKNRKDDMNEYYLATKMQIIKIIDDYMMNFS